MKTQTFSSSYNTDEYDAVFAQARRQALVLRDEAIRVWLGALFSIIAHPLHVVLTRAMSIARVMALRQSGKVIE